MSLLNLIIVIVVFGVALWAVNAYVPMQAQIKRLLNIVIVVVLVLWVLQALGFVRAISHIRIG